MGKIRKAASEKHNATLSVYVSNFIDEALAKPTHLLPSHLASFPSSWPFLRGDLYHWIKLLNRFDDVLEQFSNIYRLSQGPQRREFTCELLLSGEWPRNRAEQTQRPTPTQLEGLGFAKEGDREVVESVLAFSTLLLDNCANRSLYASSDILNHLLHTESLSLTITVLTLTLRLAQRYSSSKIHRNSRTSFLENISQPVLSHYYKIDLQRVERLAQPFHKHASGGGSQRDEDGRGHSKRFAFDLVQLVRDEQLTATERDELGTVVFGFPKSNLGGDSPEIPASPTPDRRAAPPFGVPSRGNLVATPSHQQLSVPQADADTVCLSAHEVSSLPMFELLRICLEKVPEASHYELFTRMRFARALIGNLSTRQQAVQIRLLAIANLAHLYPESMLQDKIFQQEVEESRRAQTPYQLCSLVHPPGKHGASVPRRIQVLALNVLEAFTNHKNRCSEVAQCLNINVSHGVLTYILRKVNSELAEEPGAEGQQELNDYCDALFALLRALPSQLHRAREGMVNMGILGILSDSLQLRTSVAERNHIRTIASIDGLVFNTPNGLPALFDSKGLDVLADLLVHEVDVACKAAEEGRGYPTEYKTQQTDYKIPFVQQQILRNLLRHVNHMTTSTIAGFERTLRNLIEHPPLLGSLRVLISRPEDFGSSIWSCAVEIFANFINQEPTSWTAIGESGVTRTFLDTISRESAPISESSESAVLTGMLPTVEAISCVPLAIGALCLNHVGFEQLEQTHALEKFFGIFISPAHVQALTQTSHSRDAVEGLGAHFDEIARHHPTLRPQILNVVSALAGKLVDKVYSPESISQEGCTLAEPNTSNNADAGDVHMQEAPRLDQENSARPSPKGLDYFAVYIKFLIGFFGNTNLVAYIQEHNDSFERLVDLATAPSWPAEFLTPADNSVGIKLNELFTFLAESKPHLILPLLAKRLLSALQSLDDFSNLDSGATMFCQYICEGDLNDFVRSATGDGIMVLRNLLVVRTLCSIFAKILPMTSHRGPLNCFATVNLCDVYVEIVERLGRLQRRVIWEDILVRLSRPCGPVMSFSSIRSTNTNQNRVHEQSQGDDSAPDHTQASERNQAAGSQPPANSSETPSEQPANFKDRNLQTIRSIFGTLPSSIAKVFISLGKSLLHKRTATDPFQKQLLMTVAESLAHNLSSTLSYSLPEAMPESAKDTYRFIAISHCSLAIVEHLEHAAMDRSALVVHTLVTHCFRKCGGLEVLSRLAHQMFARCIVSGPETELESRLRLNGTGTRASFEGLRIILCLFQNLTQQKLVSEAPQSVILNKDREKDYFSTAQFLTELRYDAARAILPIWQSEALDQASPGLVKLVCSAFKNILDGGGEQGALRRSDKPVNRDKPIRRFWRPRNDTENISRLGESGLDEGMALEALYRCNDNMAFAREYCVAHRRNPHFPRLPIPSRYLEASSITADDDRGSPSALAQQPFAVSPGQDMGVTVGAGPAVTADDLEALRSDLQTNLMEQCLNVLGSFPSLTFELSELIIASIPDTNRSSVQEEASKTLVMSLISLQGDVSQENATQIASYAHLLGVLLQEPDFFTSARGTLKDDFGGLLSFVSLPQERLPSDTAPWIGHILLIMERLLSEDAQPRAITWSPDMTREQSDRVVELGEPLVSQQDRDQLFQRLLSLLPRVGKDAALALSICRVLVILTRERRLALELGQRRHLQKLFLMTRQLVGFVHGKLETAFMLILRHVVEDEDTIRTVIRTEICNFVQSQPGGRPVEMSAMTRQLYHLVLRQPEVFVETCNEILVIPRYEKHGGGGNPVLGLKPELQPNSQPRPRVDLGAEEKTDVVSGVEPTGPDADEKSQTTELKPPAVEHSDGVVHFLLSELLAYKDVADQSNTQPVDSKNSAAVGPTTLDTGVTAVAGDAKADATTSEKPAFHVEEHIHFVYRCFILRCLAELLQSYNRTKVEFINFSRKADPKAATPSKPRSGVLNYFLHGLIPGQSLSHPQDVSSQKSSSTSDWAIRAIAALCARTPERHSVSRREHMGTENEPDLLFVRRFVLEHALKAFRDTNASGDAFEPKYSKLMSLADLFNRMLQGRPDNYRRAPDGPAQDNLVPTQKQLAKVMFEKGFLTALTQSISEVDLKLEGAQRAVKYILRPLKLLTHTAIELSLTSDLSTAPGQASLDTDENDEISSATSLSDDEDMREETPDLFRNSTLGMFESRGDEDEESDDSSEDGDDEMYDEEDYDEELDYDDDDREHDDEVVSDPDEEMDGMGPIEGLSGDVPMEVQIEIDEDEVDGADEDDEDEEDEEDDLEDEDDEDEDMSEDDDSEHEHLTHDDGLPLGAAFVDDINDWAGGHDEDDGADDLEDDLADLGYTEADGDGSDNDLEPFTGAAVASLGAMDGGDGEDEDIVADEESEDGEEEVEDEFEEDLDDYPVPEDEADGGAVMPPLVFGWPNGTGSRRPVRHRWTEWDYEIPDDRAIVGGYRSHRGPSVQNVRGEDHTANPLLSREQQGAPRSANWPGGLRRPEYIDLEQGAGRGIGNGIARLLQLGGPGDGNPSDDAALVNLLNLLGHHRGVNPFSVHPHPSGGLSFSLNMAHGHGHGHHHHHHHHHSALRDMNMLNAPVSGHRHQASAGPHSPLRDATAAVAFDTVSTDQRWQEEARLLFGSRYTEKCLRVVNSLMRLLVPPAIEAERLKRQKEEDVRRERERQEEEKRQQEEDLRRREEEERLERETQEAAQRDSEGEAVDEGNASAMEGVEATTTAATDNHTTAENQQPRVYANIRGRPIDITELGIDIEVLEALPEEMREEVVMQQFHEHRSNLRDAGEEPSDLNAEFLDALPTEIRNELLQQEAADRRRREREEERQRRRQQSGNATLGTAAAQPDDMNPADFMASLDPILRQSVLAEADEETLSQLPPELAAEARALGGHRRRALDNRIFRSVPDLNANAGASRGIGATGRETDEGLESRPQRRPIVQMLDRAGIATLLRLMFVPIAGNARSSLNGILRNACGNRQTRHEVLGGLLAILQDGSADVSAVEKSFAHLTVRAKQHQQGLTKTPQSNKKGLVTPLSTSTQPGSVSEASPLTVVSQCLMALEYLTHSVSHVPHFFFTENEAFAMLRSKATRKSKSKDALATRYPLNSLLALLDREVVVNNLPVMEQLAALLASIAGPLANLLRKEAVGETDQGRNDKTKADRPDSGSGDAIMTEATATIAAASETKDQATNAKAEASTSEPKDRLKESDKKRFTPPTIPEENLRLVINLITASESNSKAFRDTLSSMTSLSTIPGARWIFGDELNKQAHLLANSIRPKLTQLLEGLGSADNEIDAQSLALTIFPSAGSLLIKISRVLTALDYLFEPKPEDGKDDLGKAEEGQQLLNGLYQDESFVDLWSQLSACMATLQTDDRYFFNVATILLPLVEALMIACKRMPGRDVLNTAGVSNMRTVFFAFTNKHRKILNDLVRHNPKLMSGAFSTLAKNSGVLEFDNKRNFFNRRLHQRAPELRHHHSPALQLHVRRDQVFLDSYKALYFKTPEEIKYGKFNIRFSGEEGVDAGGVTREWFQVLARQMFNADYALFNPVASDRTTFHPNSLSSINPEHLQFFKFIGRMIGKALYENRVLDCHFSRAVYKRILGKSVSMKDMETIDLDYSKGMEWILGNDITDVITETFSLEQDSFGVTDIIDLVPNGRNITVTEENKEDYVRRVIDYKLTGAVKEQLQSFLEGFHDIVPAELIRIFDEGELELLISGMPDVDIDDWKNNTEYHNYSAASPQVQWFWRAVRSFDKEEVAKLLQFVTGTGKVPLNGFKELEGMNGFTRFSIHKDFGSKDRLPSSHTCFNQLDLPEYDNYEALRKGLYTAMTTGNEYFGYA